MTSCGGYIFAQQNIGYCSKSETGVESGGTAFGRSKNSPRPSRFRESKRVRLFSLEEIKNELCKKIHLSR